MKRCNRNGKDNAILIVVLFYGSCYSPSDTDAIATHENDLLFTILVQISGIHCLRIFGSQFEDMPNFNPAPHLELPMLAARTGIARLNIAQVSKAIYSEITLKISI